MPEGLSASEVEGLDRSELVAVVIALVASVERLDAEVVEARLANDRLVAENEKLVATVARLRGEAGRNSGNSSKPSSRDSAAERQRQAAERKARADAKANPAGRKKGKQRGAKGHGPKLSDTPDAIVDHEPLACGGCGAELSAADDDGFARRQVIDLPTPAPVVTEHRAHRRRCRCGKVTSGAFPAHVSAPLTYGPSVKAAVTYLLCRQHIPVERCREAMKDLYGLALSAGSINNFYSEAARRLRPFITALIALLKTLPVLHADETTDRVGTETCWMHVLSTSKFTLIHASMSRGGDAIREVGVLLSYRGVVIHDRLALYWTLPKAKHGLCGAHLLRDLADVAIVASQRAWASGLAALLVEINTACDQARLAGHRKVAPTLRREFSARYDQYVTDGQALNPDPPKGRKRDYYQRRSYNLVTAFATHKKHILRYMHDLDTSFSNNQAERDLRPGKLHRKISACFGHIEGARRHADLRSYLSTTRKHDIPALAALNDLFTGTPWMPSQDRA